MFYFIHVQGQNALTTLLHLADDLILHQDKELPNDQGGYQVIIILPIKIKMAAAKKQYFLRFLYWTESSPPPFKVRGLQMTIKLALV